MFYFGDIIKKIILKNFPRLYSGTCFCYHYGISKTNNFFSELLQLSAQSLQNSFGINFASIYGERKTQTDIVSRNYQLPVT